MARVLVVATSRKTRGGITSVIKAHETGEQWKRFHCHWVETHRDGPAWRKLLYLFWGYFDFAVRILFYDIVHFHISLKSTVKRKYPLFILAKILHKKTIVHLHCGTQIEEIWNNRYNSLFRSADLSLVLSDVLKHKVEEKIGGNSHIEVLYNPCPSVIVDVSHKQNIILFSGTITKGKGYHDLILAFSKIAELHSDWVVVFAGNGEIDEGISLAKELGIESQIKFVGWVNGVDKSKLFNDAKIFCLPSYAEGFPMAVLDAWAYGLPVITTPVGGIPDVAIDGENMLLFAPGDIDKLAKNIDTLISDKSLRGKISEASMRFAKGEFNVNTINNRLCEIYESI